MMDAEARLAAALAASAAPARDQRFTLGVMKAAEADRFRVEALRSMLSWGALAGAGAGLALFVAGSWVIDVPGVQNGALGAGAIFALVATSRLMTQRLAAATSR